ncbi:MAG: radical SAM family heme chaperone HemW [Pseudomonadota bacterium]
MSTAIEDRHRTTAHKRFGVYVHWPYCTRICPYCDFNVFKSRPVDADRWRDVLLADLAYWHRLMPDHQLVSIYFGGGTPSLAPVNLVGSLIETATRLWAADSSIEITLEANPTDAETTRLNDFAQAGVNRISLGVQSFSDDELKFLGRNHSGREAIDSVEKIGALFDRYTFDLIYALPEQTLPKWEETLTRAAGFGSPHLSAYQLTIEPGTAFERAVERGQWKPPDDDKGADFYQLTQHVLETSGLLRYETSNHARPGYRAIHNQLYWQGHDYVGIGPGAHGRVTLVGNRVATKTVSQPTEYLRLDLDPTDRLEVLEPLTPEGQFIERLSMGLRWVDGLVLSADEQDRLSGKLAQLEADNLLKRDGLKIRLTETGQMLVNSVVAELIAD